MKWIKHMTATRRDEKIARLMEEGGDKAMARYGLYWAVQEIIAEHMEGPNPSCTVSYPVRVWARLLAAHPPNVVKQLVCLESVGLLKVVRTESEVSVTNVNLLKYRDEYSKKSRQTPDNVPSNSAPDTEAEGKGDTESTKKSPTDSSGSSEPDLKTWANGLVKTSFEFYVQALKRDPKKYTLTEFRRKKALSRLRERYKLHKGDRALVAADVTKAIENLAASDYHQTGRFVDWVSQIFRSEEEFQKRLSWEPDLRGGTNGNRASATKRQPIDENSAVLQRNFPGVFGEDSPSGSGSGTPADRKGPDTGRPDGAGVARTPRTIQGR